jgi:hypothetical protein
LNLKFDVDIDQTGVEQAINDYSPFSLSMFMDAMNVLQDASATLNNTAGIYSSLEDRVNALENLVLSSETTFTFDRRISQIENSLAANQALFNNTQAVMGLINQNYELIRAIINNETSVEISYNLNLIKQGQGIIVDRSIPNELTISNNNQDYHVGARKGTVTLQNSSPNTIPLLTFGNYYKHVNNGVPITLTSDLVIRLDDSVVNWKLGQVMRFSFGDQIIPGNFNVNFLTNAQGRYPLANPTQVPYSTLILSLTNNEFVSYDYKPVIDIVCVDPENLIFQVDQIGKSLTNNT